MAQQYDIITQLFGKSAQTSQNLPTNKSSNSQSGPGSGIILLALGALTIYILMRKK